MRLKSWQVSPHLVFPVSLFCYGMRKSKPTNKFSTEVKLLTTSGILTLSFTDLPQDGCPCMCNWVLLYSEFTRSPCDSRQSRHLPGLCKQLTSLSRQLPPYRDISGCLVRQPWGCPQNQLQRQVADEATFDWVTTHVAWMFPSNRLWKRSWWRHNGSCQCEWLGPLGQHFTSAATCLRVWN